MAFPDSLYLEMTTAVLVAELIPVVVPVPVTVVPKMLTPVDPLTEIPVCEVVMAESTS